MKNLILAILGILALLLGLFLALPKTGHCWWCYSGPCYSSDICGPKCVCVKNEPYDVEGRCMVIEN